MKRTVCFLMVMLFAVCFSKGAFAAEHPGEHPGTPAKAEQEHPGKKATLSADEVRKSIESYIKNDSNLKGGYSLLYDAKDKQVLQLNLVRVHDDRISYIKKEDAYFACSDFKTADGKTAYDIDFWMKKDGHGELEVTKIVIHKKDGKPRFTYKDDENVPVESGKMAPEEHT